VIMYLLGMDSVSNPDFATYVFLKRVWKNLKKQYYLIDIKRFHSDTCLSEIKNEIVKIYTDRKYIIKEPHFNQNGRPAIKVYSNPKVFINFTDTDACQTDSFKKMGIPIETVFITGEKRWRKEIHGKCLGNNYYVPKYFIVRNLLMAFEQNRIIIEKGLPFADNLLNGIKTYQKDKDLPRSENDDVVLALSMPVWYYENFLSIKSYSEE